MTYSNAFDAQIIKTLGFEGGYVDDPADPGGETNFGISKRAFPSFNIAALTKDEAVAIYWEYYWVRYHADAIARTCPLAAGKYFDMCVNMGPARAGRILQEELNRYQWAGLEVDGAVGPETLAAAAKALDAGLHYWLTLGSEAYYRGLAADHPVMRKFLVGWLRRAAA